MCIQAALTQLSAGHSCGVGQEEEVVVVVVCGGYSGGVGCYGDGAAAATEDSDER